MCQRLTRGPGSIPGASSPSRNRSPKREGIRTLFPVHLGGEGTPSYPDDLRHVPDRNDFLPRIRIRSGVEFRPSSFRSSGRSSEGSNPAHQEGPRIQFSGGYPGILPDSLLVSLASEVLSFSRSKREDFGVTMVTRSSKAPVLDLRSDCTKSAWSPSSPA